MQPIDDRKVAVTQFQHRLVEDRCVMGMGEQVPLVEHVDPDLAIAHNAGGERLLENIARGQQREIATFASVFRQSAGTVTFTWGPPIPATQDMLSDDADPGGGRYYNNLKYRMVFLCAGADTTISVLVDLYLREQADGWSIYKWADQQDGLGNATLGLVRWRGSVVY